MVQKGLLISIEGLDGTGKSTVAQHLLDCLRGNGLDPLYVREPGSTNIGENLRELILREKRFEIAPIAEVFLYMAARAQLIYEKISSHLVQGGIIIADRFIDSSIVYQGIGLGIGVDKVKAVYETFFMEIYPSLTIILDAPIEICTKRLKPQKDRIEARPMSYYDVVRKGFIQLPKLFPERRYVILDSSVPIERVKNEAWKEVNSLLK